MNSTVFIIFFSMLVILNPFYGGNIRFNKKRLEEELEVVRSKAIHLQAQVVTPVVEKLQEELRGYQEILKCSICHDRPKEVNILFIIAMKNNPADTFMREKKLEVYDS